MLFKKLGNEGQGLTEYLILILLISVVCISAVKSLGGTVKDKLQQVRKEINEGVVQPN